MLAYVACTIAFFAGLVGVAYYGTVCLSRLTNWNDRRRERALAYRRRMRVKRVFVVLDEVDWLPKPPIEPKDLFGPIDVNDLNRWRREP